MPTLAEKLVGLERTVAVASRALEFWRKQVDVYGEKKAQEFYVHIGLNHLDSKSTVEWEGLTLSRQPNDVEKLCVKSISQAQDSGKDSVKAILLKARESMVGSALAAIKKLTPATYHELVLTMPDKAHSELRAQLSKVFMKGKTLVSRELDGQKGKSIVAGSAFKQAQPTEDDDSELDDLADLTDARVANDIQSRITAAASRFALLGLTGKALWDAVANEINTGSISYIDRAATGLANRVLNFGRSREAEDRKDDWARVEYSALLDANVCDPCASEDGQEASDESDLTPVPNPDCAGGDWCRCFHVFIAEGVM